VLFSGEPIDTLSGKSAGLIPAHGSRGNESCVRQGINREVEVGNLDHGDTLMSGGVVRHTVRRLSHGALLELRLMVATAAKV